MQIKKTFSSVWQQVFWKYSQHNQIQKSDANTLNTTEYV